ncbi:MAG: hypothetical protein KJ674_02510 [Nanoarchaeota archaeon]|nr:hypothetical protein [Nanoarchaeota archaeon]
MKKIFSILVLLLIVGIITGCGPKVTEPETPPTTTDTVVDTELGEIGGDIDDFSEISDDDLGDIDLDEDLPPL